MRNRRLIHLQDRFKSAPHVIDRGRVFHMGPLIKFPLPETLARCGEGEGECTSRDEAPGMALDPFHRAHRRGRRASQDRFVLEKPAQIFRKRRRARVAVARFLLQTFQANRLEIARDARPMPRGRDRILRDHAHHDGGFAFFRQERRTAREDFVEDRA